MLPLQLADDSFGFLFEERRKHVPQSDHREEDHREEEILVELGYTCLYVLCTFVAMPRVDSRVTT